MGVIKSANAPPTSSFSMRDIEAHARAIIARSQQQADQLLADAQGEGVKIRQHAYDEGFTAGREDGLRKGKEDGLAAGKQTALTENRANLEQLIKTLTSTVTELDSSRSRLESIAGTEVVKLAVAIARRVTKLQGACDPNVLTENVRQAMKLVIHAADVRIAVHPGQKQILQDALVQLKKQWPNVTHVELVEDESLTPGGCRVFTAHGEVDAHLESQIDRIANELLPHNNGASA